MPVNICSLFYSMLTLVLVWSLTGSPSAYLGATGQYDSRTVKNTEETARQNTPVFQQVLTDSSLGFKEESEDPVIAERKPPAAFITVKTTPLRPAKFALRKTRGLARARYPPVETSPLA